METSAISYRVADFLKNHPPFQGMEEADLVDLAARGRVKFHEPNEYILWQREPHRHHVFVIQQGTVSLWDEANVSTTVEERIPVDSSAPRIHRRVVLARGAVTDLPFIHRYRSCFDQT